MDRKQTTRRGRFFQLFIRFPLKNGYWIRLREKGYFFQEHRVSMRLGNHGNGKLQVKPYRDFTADSGRGRFGRKNPIPGPSQNLTLVQHEPCPARFVSPPERLRQGISRRADWPLAENPSGLGSCRAGHAHSGRWEPRASASPPACPEKVWWGGIKVVLPCGGAETRKSIQILRVAFFLSPPSVLVSSCVRRRAGSWIMTVCG